MNPKLVVLLLVEVVSFVNGAADQYFYPGQFQSPTDLWFLAAYALLTFAWFRLDTDERSYRRTPLLSVLVVAVALVALPYYFFRSRGAKGGFIALGLFVLVFMASGALSAAGEYTVSYALQG